jgi:hypothetical protein
LIAHQKKKGNDPMLSYFSRGALSIHYSQLGLSINENQPPSSKAGGVIQLTARSFYLSRSALACCITRLKTRLLLPAALVCNSLSLCQDFTPAAAAAAECSQFSSALLLLCAVIFAAERASERAID